MLDRRHVLVTGARNGIGQAVASRFLRDGHYVSAADMPMPAVRAGDRFNPLELDVRSRASHENAMAAATDRFGRVSVLVTHAFIGLTGPLEAISLAEWNLVLAVNLRGAMYSVQAAVANMVAGDTIIVTSSIAGRRYSSVMGAHYTVARYGLIGLARHLAAELAGRGIRINVVCPGPPNTPQMWEVTSAESRDLLAKNTPLRQLAEPEDVADVVYFLSRPGHMHGAVVDVNGGLY